MSEAHRGKGVSAIVGRRTLYTSPWCAVRAKDVVVPGEPGVQTFLSVKPADYVTVVAVTRDGHLPLVRQYRPVVESYTVELPSGLVEAGERPEDAARRELLEETGCTAGELRRLGCLIPDSGRLENRLWAFFAPGVATGGALGDVREGIEVLWCAPAEVRQMVRDGRLSHALHLGVLALSLLRGDLVL